MDRSPHKSDFVKVNGVRLHYLDWGGDGPALLFLPGLGCNAHIFGRFAPRFTDKFRVLALTRRGHGESDQPKRGYDIDTLTEDIRKFLDALGIDQVILVGHSMAHIELSHFNALYPERVLRLVFLDAAYDRTSESYKNMVAKSPLRRLHPPDAKADHYSAEDYFASIRREYPSFTAIWSDFFQEQALHDIIVGKDGKVADKMTNATGGALHETLTSYVPEDSKIKCPALGIYAISNGRYYLANGWMTEEQKTEVQTFFETVSDAWIRENIERFQQLVPHARVVVIPEGHHYCFIREEERVYKEIWMFLLEG